MCRYRESVSAEKDSGSVCRVRKCLFRERMCMSITIVIECVCVCVYRERNKDRECREIERNCM